jgi:hypothetical protein
MEEIPSLKCPVKWEGLSKVEHVKVEHLKQREGKRSRSKGRTWERSQKCLCPARLGWGIEQLSAGG